MFAYVNEFITVNAAYKLNGVMATGLSVTCKVIAPDASITTPSVTEVGSTGVYRAAPFAATQSGDYVFIYSAPPSATDERDVVGLRNVVLPISQQVWAASPGDFGGTTMGGYVNGIRDTAEQTLAAAQAVNGKLPADTTAKLAKLDATISSRCTPADLSTVEIDPSEIWAHPTRTVTGFEVAATQALALAAEDGANGALSSSGIETSLDDLAEMVSGLGSNPIVLVSPMTSVDEATIDLNWDWVAANGQALVFSGVGGSLDLDECGLYVDGANAFIGTYTTASGGTIKVGISRAQASILGRGVHCLELGYAKNGVRTLITKVKLRVL